jgi:RNA polymerase sigma-70 factor (ECF subfamily)
MLHHGPLGEVTSENGDLLNRLREGNPDAWHNLSEAFRKRLRDRADSALPTEVAGRADASDIVQQTLAEANESFPEFEGSTLAELDVWLAAILRNNTKDAVREHVLAQRRTVRMECHLDDASDAGAGWDGVSAADQTSPSMAAARNETDELLRLAIDNLPPRQRDAVRMRHLEGRPLEDIAAQLDCTAQAAAAVIARGLRSLRESLKDLE